MKLGGWGHEGGGRRESLAKCLLREGQAALPAHSPSGGWASLIPGGRGRSLAPSLKAAWGVCAEEQAGRRRER